MNKGTNCTTIAQTRTASEDWKHTHSHTPVLLNVARTEIFSKHMTRIRIMNCEKTTNKLKQSYDAYQVDKLIEKTTAEIMMWRQREIDNMLFVDSKEEKWFTSMLLELPVGLENVDDFAEKELKCYRETHAE